MAKKQANNPLIAIVIIVLIVLILIGLGVYASKQDKSNVGGSFIDDVGNVNHYQ